MSDTTCSPCKLVYYLKKDVRPQKMGDPVMAHAKLPAIKSQENDNPHSIEVAHLFKPSSSIFGNAVNADKIGAKYEDGILHIALPKRGSIHPKPAKEMNIPCIQL